MYESKFTCAYRWKVVKTDEAEYSSVSVCSTIRFLVLWLEIRTRVNIIPSATTTCMHACTALKIMKTYQHHMKKSAHAHAVFIPQRHTQWSMRVHIHIYEYTYASTHTEKSHLKTKIVLKILTTKWLYDSKRAATISLVRDSGDITDTFTRRR
jgi:hypothetical protein